MNASTLARYLVGDAAAIRAVAATRHAWLVGLVFVLGAGLAREYDHEDLAPRVPAAGDHRGKRRFRGAGPGRRPRGS